MKVHDVEQRSPEWYALRAGMPTASEFSKVITSKGDPSKSAGGYAVTLAGELFARKPLDAWEGNEWTERGKVMEDEAVSLYEFATDRETTPVGFITSNEMGCSPDRLVGDDGMVEVKCLKAERHIDAIMYFRKHGRCKTDYVQQTQGQLMIAERQWCDLIFYHPELPLLTIRQTPNTEIHEALRAEIAGLCIERDRIYAALCEQANPTKEAA